MMRTMSTGGVSEMQEECRSLSLKASALAVHQDAMLTYQGFGVCRFETLTLIISSDIEDCVEHTFCIG